MKPLILTINDIVEIIKGRQANGNDSRIAVTGETNSGKSTAIAKILFRFDNFQPWKHQVYNRTDVIDLLTSQEGGICWDDEAINSSYSRSFQSSDQHELIRILTAYRSNRNAYFSTLPEFFTLDKHIRDLFYMHIHVIAHGFAVIHMKNVWALYSKDKWDSTENEKIERKWVAMRIKNPMFKPPFHKLSTFRAYLFFNDLTPNQRKLIEEVKKKKRADSFESKNQSKELPFIDKVYKMLLDGKLNKEGLQTICQMEDKKYSSINITLNRMLNDDNESRTVKDFFRLSVDKKDEDATREMENLVPDISEP